MPQKKDQNQSVDTIVLIWRQSLQKNEMNVVNKNIKPVFEWRKTLCGLHSLKHMLAKNSTTSFYNSLLVTAIVSFIFKMAWEAAAYLFFPTLFLLNAMFAYHMLREKAFNRLLKSFLRSFSLLLVLGFWFFVEYFVIDLKTNVLHVEMANMAIVINLLFILYISDRASFGQKKWVGQLNTALFYSSLLISIVGFFKFFMGQTWLTLLPIYEGGYPHGTSLVFDYNMYSLSILIGLIIAFEKWYRCKKRSMVYPIVILFQILILFHSGSRRAMIILIILFIYLAVSQLLLFYKKKKPFQQYSKLAKKNRMILIILLSTTVIGHLAVVGTSTRTKQYLMNYFGQNDRKAMFSLIQNGYRIQSLFINRPEASAVEQYLTNDLDKSEMCKRVNRFFEKNIINKQKEKQYKSKNLLYNGSFRYGLFGWKHFLTRSSNYLLSHEEKTNVYLQKTHGPVSGIYQDFIIYRHDTLRYSAWVKVLQWDSYARLEAPGPGMDDVLFLKPDSNWAKDNHWHLLEMIVPYTTSGNGYVFIGGGGHQSEGCFMWKSIRIDRINKLETRRAQYMADDPYPAVNCDNMGDKAQAFVSVNKNKGVQAPKKLYKKSLFSDNQMIESRASRWVFALELFQISSWKKKISGSGFQYLKSYNDSNQKMDYPHNPFLTALLFGGIIGLLLHIALFLQSFINYFKQKKLIVFLILSLCFFFFSFFSGNTVFSIPPLVFLAMLPLTLKDGDEKENKTGGMQKP